MTTSRVVEDATCLGCGCTCDDIQLIVADDRIVDSRRTCHIGRIWFGSGNVAALAQRAGIRCAPEEALDDIAGALLTAAAPLVYLAPELSCEAQREAVAIADLLRASIDSVSSHAMPAVLAAQRRGRASATLGEIRNRADLVIFWGVDPDHGHPRFRERYAPEASGRHVPDGRRSRTVIAVDIAAARGIADADLRVQVSPAGEVAGLVRLAALLDALVTEAAVTDATVTEAPAPAPARAEPAAGHVISLEDLAARIGGARYVAIVADADRVETDGREGDRVEALLVLSLALNGPTRGGLHLLRAGGNRSGADAVLTWQTGFPAAVDFARGYPRYEPHTGTALARLSRRDADVVLVLGAANLIRSELLAWMTRGATCVIGPRATESVLGHGVAAVDTAVPGIHESGTVLRMDDVPLPVRGVLRGPPTTESIARALRERIVAMQGMRAPRATGARR